VNDVSYIHTPMKMTPRSGQRSPGTACKTPRNGVKVAFSAHRRRAFIRGTFRLQYDAPFWNAPVLRFPVFDGGDLEMIIIVFLELFDDRDYHKRSNR
jgi:hypothetical protein